MEFIISSPDSCIVEKDETGISLGTGDNEEAGGEERIHVMGSLQADRRRIPEPAAADGDSSQETLILGNRRFSGSSRRASD